MSEEQPADCSQPASVLGRFTRPPATHHLCAIPSPGLASSLTYYTEQRCTKVCIIIQRTSFLHHCMSRFPSGDAATPSSPMKGMDPLPPSSKPTVRWDPASHRDGARSDGCACSSATRTWLELPAPAAATAAHLPPKTLPQLKARVSPIPSVVISHTS